MAYNMKRGNSAVPFKELGSSPAKHGTTDDFLYGKNGHNPDTMEGKHEDWHTDKIEAEKKKPSPNKQMTDFSNVTVDGEDAEAVKKRSIKQREEIKKKKEQEMTDLINNPDQTINKEKFQHHGEYKPKKK